MNNIINTIRAKLVVEEQSLKQRVEWNVFGALLHNFSHVSELLPT